MSRATAGRSRQAIHPGTEALRQALRYAAAAAGQVTPELMPRPTPCRRWDLRMLLLHAPASLTALAEGFDGGRIGLYPDDSSTAAPADPRLAFRQRAWRLLGSCARADRIRSVVTIGGCPMAANLLATAGALEIAAHGWDIAQACGSGTPIPAPLATELLLAAPLLISPADREGLFASPVAAPEGASASDRLAAYLGRSWTGADRQEPEVAEPLRPVTRCARRSGPGRG